MAKKKTTPKTTLDRAERAGKAHPCSQFPPDKGGKGGYILYNKTLTEKTRENRKNPTQAENKLWFEVLQNKQFANLKFTRQKPLDEYIVDFYCSKLMLAIEIDGDSHAEQVEYDQRRTLRLNQLGVEVIRYTNQDVLNTLNGVYLDLLEKIKRRQQPPKSPLSGGLETRSELEIKAPSVKGQVKYPPDQGGKGGYSPGLLTIKTP